MQKKEKYIKKGFLIIILLLFGLWFYRNAYLQPIFISRISKGITQKNTDTEVLSDTAHLYPKDSLILGDEYQIHIQFVVVNRMGFGLFREHYSGDQSNLANLGCSTLEITQNFVATSKHIKIDMPFSITAEEIVDMTGNVYEPKKNMLYPIVKITKISD